MALAELRSGQTKRDHPIFTGESEEYWDWSTVEGGIGYPGVEIRLALTGKHLRLWQILIGNY